MVTDEKYFTLKEALDFLQVKGFKRSLGWLRIEILKKNVRSVKFHSSRVVFKEDLEKLAENLK